MIIPRRSSRAFLSLICVLTLGQGCAADQRPDEGFVNVEGGPEVPCDDRPCDLTAVSFGADGAASLSVADTPNLWRRARHRTFALVAPGQVRIMGGS